MDKEQFKAKFEGKKVTWGSKTAGHEPELFGDMKWARMSYGDICLHGYNDHEWSLWKEPEPAFDWEAEGFWGWSLGFNVCLFSKTSAIIWARISPSGQAGSNYTKKEILQEYKPCPKPDNASDYGVDE